ncbi:hypothetical protein UCREL1_3843 [Eutypa lata UCREL1]|uniref:Uncharacterized protein n=1 Tax=Eutypa lata (strain UCR-EL1) TaxID=1287681 RepID=M7SY23_EUTLA|nr:hypothetical protein UCREL1_3843 [Eutypa lata UCREL1]
MSSNNKDAKPVGGKHGLNKDEANAEASANRTKHWEATPGPITFLGGIVRSPEELKHKLAQFKERSDQNGNLPCGWVTRQDISDLEIDEYIMQIPLHEKAAYKKLMEAAASSEKSG